MTRWLIASSEYLSCASYIILWWLKLWIVPFSCHGDVIHTKSHYTLCWLSHFCITQRILLFQISQQREELLKRQEAATDEARAVSCERRKVLYCPGQALAAQAPKIEGERLHGGGAWMVQLSCASAHSRFNVSCQGMLNRLASSLWPCFVEASLTVGKAVSC